MKRFCRIVFQFASCVRNAARQNIVRKASSFPLIIFALAGLIAFLAYGQGDSLARPSATSQPKDIAVPPPEPIQPTSPSVEAKPKPTFTGEFAFKEQLEFTVSGDKHELDLRANIPFQVSWNEKVGTWKISGSVKDARGTATMRSSRGMSCSALLIGKIDIDGFVEGEKLKVCTFKLNINQEWDDYVYDCSIPRAGHIQVPELGFTLNHVFDFETEAGLKSKSVQAGIMKGFLRLQITKFSGTLIDQCGVMY